MFFLDQHAECPFGGAETQHTHLSWIFRENWRPGSLLLIEIISQAPGRVEFCPSHLSSLWLHAPKGLLGPSPTGLSALPVPLVPTPLCHFSLTSDASSCLPHFGGSRLASHDPLLMLRGFSFWPAALGQCPTNTLDLEGWLGSLFGG